MNNIQIAIKNLISEGTKGATFAILTTETESKSFMNKGRGANANPFFGKVVKRSFLNICLGFDYHNGVNNLAKKEGKEERETKPRSWGVITEDKIFVEHKGEFYLRTRVMGTMQAPVFIDSTTGEEVEKEVLAPWLKESSPKSSTQSDLEGEVVERDYNVSGIRTLKTNGKTLDFTSTHVQDFSELVEGVAVN